MTPTKKEHVPHLYEGPLPSAVAKDFTFLTVLVSRAEMKDPLSVKYGHSGDIPQNAYDRARQSALESAVEGFRMKEKIPVHLLDELEIIADVRVKRDTLGHDLVTSFGTNMLVAKATIVVEAIGYKRITGSAPSTGNYLSQMP